MKQFHGHVIVAGAVLALAVALQLTAAPVEWEFPRLGSCHEGMAFSDGVTGVLVWGGGDEIRLTIGRADLWDHRGGYEWTSAQSYTNIVAAVESGDTERLMALFKKETPKGQPRNPYMLPLGRVVLKIPGATLTRGELDPFTGTAWIDFATAAGATTLKADFSADGSDSLPSRDLPPRLFALTVETASFAPAGKDGARNFFARSAKANGFGSADGSGSTQSWPTSRLERNSRRLTTMQSS